MAFAPRFFAAFLYSALVSGVVATMIWFVLVRRIGATRAATFHFLNPFFGVAIAAAVLGEHVTVRDVVGVAIIMAGILAVQLGGGQAAEKTRKIRAGKRLESGWKVACHFLTGA